MSGKVLVAGFCWTKKCLSISHSYKKQTSFFSPAPPPPPPCFMSSVDPSIRRSESARSIPDSEMCSALVVGGDWWRQGRAGVWLSLTLLSVLCLNLCCRTLLLLWFWICARRTFCFKHICLFFIVGRFSAWRFHNMYPQQILFGRSVQLK